MGTTVQTIDISAARPDTTNTPALVFIAGTNFPPSGYAFPQSSSQAIYLPFRASQYGSGNLTLALTWYSRSGSTTGNVTWSAALAAITPGDAVSVEAKSFATAQTATTAVNSTAKGDTLSTITISNLDSLSSGDDAWIKITRTDTSMTGDAILIGAELSYSDGNSGTPGSGDFVGPASATDTALVRFSGTTGKLGQNSAISCDSSGNLTGVGNLNGVALPTVWVPGSQRIFSSQLPAIAGAATTSGVAYFVYVGLVQTGVTVNRVEFHVTAAGTGTTAGEVGLFSTPAAPNRASQTLTKIVATGTVDTLVSGTGLKRNTTAFAQSVAAGTHLWAGIRTAATTTQPSIYGLTADMSDGQILTTAAATAFTSGTTYTGALITAAVTWQAPMLRVTLD
jgi:hypothetical protein